ncbi:hypothetical protein BH18THE1_BH18THE1_12980 [soil metagenome]
MINLKLEWSRLLDVIFNRPDDRSSRTSGNDGKDG